MAEPIPMRSLVMTRNYGIPFRALFARLGPRKAPTGRILDINHPFPHPHTVETLIRTGFDGQVSATVEKQFPINQCVYHAALALCLAAAATDRCRDAA